MKAKSSIGLMHLIFSWDIPLDFSYQNICAVLFKNEALAVIGYSPRKLINV